MLNHENLLQALIKLKKLSIQTPIIEFKKIKEHHIIMIWTKNHHNSLNYFNLILP